MTTHVVLRSRQRFPSLPSSCPTMNCRPSTLHEIQCHPAHPAKILHKSTPKFSKTTDRAGIRCHAPASYKSNACRPLPAPTIVIDQSCGAFFEYGNGNDTGLYVTGAKGNSDVYHYGGGLLGRLNLRSGVYAEGSFRAGAMDNGFASNLLDAEGNAASYDSSSAYVGTHFGLGMVQKLASRSTLDLYGRYFYTYQGGDSVVLSTNDPVRFSGIDSHRLRLGGRGNYVLNSRVSTYLGAAWEHEFAGTAKATTYGYGIASPSLRGGTGIGELGLSFSRSSFSGSSFSGRTCAAPSIDLGVQGYVGKREGVSGGVQLRWAF